MSRLTREQEAKARSTKAWTHVAAKATAHMNDDEFFAMTMPLTYANRHKYTNDVEVQAMLHAYDPDTNTMDWDAYNEFWDKREEEEERKSWKPE